MLSANLIAKKRDGHELNEDEIRFLVDGFCRGDVADYQMSALAMAIFLRGMTPAETTTLTTAMLESGDRLSPDGSVSRDHRRVDKHSTGGLGDKVSLILAPLLAACGVEVPMVSGRGLGLSGGTLDKLESIPGFQVHPADPESILADVGAFIIGASDTVAPADRKLYALRDVTGTVESIPLITASILSKKLSASLDALVMDVKTGSAAFMKTQSDAEALAESIVRVAAGAGMPTTALVTDMDQPLGRAVGNAIEVNESLDVLAGEPGVARELTIELCADVLVTCSALPDLDSARRQLIAALDDGTAMERFERMVAAQGGRLDGKLPLAPEHVISADVDGVIGGFDCDALGTAVVSLGGGRRKTDDSIDPTVGLSVHGRIGDAVAKGQPLITLHAPSNRAGEFATTLAAAVNIVDQAVPRPLIIRRLGQST